MIESRTFVVSGIKTFFLEQTGGPGNMPVILFIHGSCQGGSLSIKSWMV